MKKFSENLTRSPRIMQNTNLELADILYKPNLEYDIVSEGLSNWCVLYTRLSMDVRIFNISHNANYKDIDVQIRNSSGEVILDQCTIPRSIFKDSRFENFFTRDKDLSWMKNMPVNIDILIPLKNTSGEWIFSLDPPTLYINEVSATSEVYFDLWKKELAKNNNELNINSYLTSIKYGTFTEDWIKERVEILKGETKYKTEVNKNYKEQDIDISNIFILEDPPSSSSGVGMNTIYKAKVYWPADYLDKNICDGDTIEVINLLPKSQNPSYWLESGKKHNGYSIYKLRCLGIQAPEVDHFDESKKVWEHGGSHKEIFTHGEISMKTMYDLLHDKNGNSVDIIIDACDVQHNTYGDNMPDRLATDGNTYKAGDDLIGHDPYGRRIGIIYANIDTGKGKQWVNINRTMIARGMATQYLQNGSGTQCHRSMHTKEHPSVQTWGGDNKLQTDNGILNTISHNPTVSTPGMSNDDRDSVLGKFDPLLQVRIGDCQFVVPPEEIAVSYITKSERISTLRSRGSMRKDTGQYMRRIQMTIFFTGVDQINGYIYINAERDKDGKIIMEGEIPKNYLPGSKGELGIKEYYINGLRSLIAQFKRTPFLPIENHVINDIHNIEAVTLQTLSINTVQGFPNTVKATIQLIEFDYNSFMPCELSFASLFNWPQFRYYYQTAMVDRYDGGDPYSTDRKNYYDYKYLMDRTYLAKVSGNYNSNFDFMVINEADLIKMKGIKEQFKKLVAARKMLIDNEYREAKEGFFDNIKNILSQWSQRGTDSKNLSDIESAIDEMKKKLDIGAGLEYMPIPGLICTGVSVSYENIITEIQLQNTPTPTHQYMGSQDAYLRATFQCDEDTLSIVRRLYERTARILRMYKDIIDNDVLVIKNEYAQLFGVENVAIEQMNVMTVKDYPGLYTVEILFVDMQRTARRMAELEKYASTALLTNDSKKAPYYEKELKDLKPNKQAIREDNEKHALDGYFKIQDALRNIEVYPDLELPTYSELRSVGFSVAAATETGIEPVFAEPDFYIHPTYKTLGQQISDVIHNSKKTSQIELWDNVGSSHRTIDVPNSNGSNAGKTFNDYMPGVTASTRSLFSGQRNEEFEKTAETIYNASILNTKAQAENGGPTTIYKLSKIEAFTHKNEEERKIFKDSGYTTLHTLIVELPHDPPKTIKEKHSDDPFKGEYVILEGFGSEFAPLHGMTFHVANTINGKSSHDVIYKLYIEDKALCDSFNKVYKDKQQPSSNGIRAYRTVPVPVQKKEIHYFRHTYRDKKTKTDKVKFFFPFNAPENVPSSQWSGEDYVFIGTPSSIIRTGERNNGWEYRWPNMVARSTDKSGQKGEFIDQLGNRYEITFVVMKYNPVTKEIETDIPIIDNTVVGGAYYFGSTDRMNSPVKEFQNNVALKFRNILDNLSISESSFAKEGTSEFEYDYGNGPSDSLDNTDPAKTFLNSCHDMIAHDKRNRLIRAFPTFHLSLIDEGRTIGQWKLHDNFYGFQALSSISVHKSRKQVADTCVIELVNAFKNLTSYDQENIDYYGRPTVWEALQALWLSKEYVQEKIENRRPDDLKSIYLKTGTRISLRMGYGSDASDLPVVFNGCITELGGEDIVTIVAQSDGIELCNIITARTDATTGTWPSLVSDDLFSTTFNNKVEPRNLICDMLTSRGGFWKNAINKISNDRFFNYNPLGIMHLGNDNIDINGWYGASGECGQNIYRVNESGEISRKQSEYVINDDIVFCMSLFNKSPWDVIQTCAMVAPDFIASVVPFGFRSTIFFGKPFYNLTYDYYREEIKDSLSKEYVIKERKKAFQQVHFYTSYTDIIENQIKASEQDIFTNVIGTYKSLTIARNERQSETPVIHTDTDIWPEKQKTAVVDTSIICRGWKPFEMLGWIPGVDMVVEGLNKLINCFVHEERVAEKIARSVLRDYLKDMYKGELYVIGDPTVKPYDLVDIADSKNNMTGLCEVKEVVIHFSEQTGFITTITPDLCVVNDDQTALARWNWIHSTIASVTLESLTTIATATTLRKLGFSHPLLAAFAPWNQSVAIVEGIVNKAVSKGIIASSSSLGLGRKAASNIISKGAEEITEGSTGKMIQGMAKGLGTTADKSGKWIFKKIFNLSDDAVEKLTQMTAKGKVASFLKSGISDISDISKLLASGSKEAINSMKTAAASASISGFLIEFIILEAISASVTEAISRQLRNRQAVVILPLKQNGIKLTAGIQGHLGCVYGDPISVWDKWTQTWSSWLQWILPGVEVNYKRYREELEEVDQFAQMTYLDKLGKSVDIGAEANRIDTSESSGIPAFMAPANSPLTTGEQVTFNFNNRNLIIDKIESSDLSSWNGNPPYLSKSESMLNAQSRFVGASIGLTAESMLSKLYSSNVGYSKITSYPDIAKHILYTPTEYNSASANNHSGPWLRNDAIQSLRAIIRELEALYQEGFVLKVSSAFRSIESNRSTYINKGVSGASYRMSDHCTGRALDISGMTYTTTVGRKKIQKEVSVYVPKNSNTVKTFTDKDLKNLHDILNRHSLYLCGPHTDTSIHNDHFHITFKAPR